MRWLLVQAAWSVWLSRHARAAPLRDWANHVARRRGVRIAIVALARRLAGILYAVWRDGTIFDARRLQRLV
jgi:transposase